MQGAWLKARVRIALAWRALLIDLNNFYLLQHRAVAGHLVSAKNSGTHWLRFMLSHALAHRYGVAPPLRSSGRLSEDFVGHPRWPRRRPDLPFIGSSHNLPSIVFSWPWLRRLLHLPPTVVLVRDPKEAMLSHFVKWKGPLGLSMHEYIRNASTRRMQLANAWWYIDFFNRWGRIAAGDPDDILVVRYEDLEAAPAYWLGRVSSHLRLGLDAEAIGAALAVSSRAAVRDTLDPAYGEAIVPEAADRAEARFPAAEESLLDDQLASHLRYDFGYGLARRSNAPAPAAPGLVVWARATFVVVAGYALFNQLGEPLLDMSLPPPWGRLELAGIFSLLTLLGPASFPKLKGTVPAALSLLGGGVELAQRIRLAPGTGAFADLLAELGGIGAALALILVIGTASPRRAVRAESASSPRPSSAAQAAAAPPGHRPG